MLWKLDFHAITAWKNNKCILCQVINPMWMQVQKYEYCIDIYEQQRQRQAGKMISSSKLNLGGDCMRIWQTLNLLLTAPTHTNQEKTL
ncbi:MAG: hypothetical protein QNJ47_16645 [Nostocaceae cyanobacterium]|nr:hypothetical protein [Nostocaceae cyanobacterium]